MTDIFISYSREDAGFVGRIYEELRNFDVRGFMDAADIAAGAEISNKLRDSIRNADAVVVILSEASRDSSWVMFELGLAESMNKLVVPVIAPGSVYERAVPEQIIDRLAIIADGNSTQEIAAKIVSAATRTSVAEAFEKVTSEKYRRRRRATFFTVAGVTLVTLAFVMALSSFMLKQAEYAAKTRAQDAISAALEARRHAEDVEIEAQRALEQVAALTSGASSIAVSPDGSSFAVGSKQGGFELIRRRNAFADFDTVARVELDDRVSSLAFSPDGQRLAVATWQAQIIVYHLTSMKAVMILRGGDSIADVAFSADGRTILSRSLGGTLDFWDAVTGANIDSMEIE